jgi:hypothetical protein
MRDEIMEELLKGTSHSVDGKTTDNLEELVFTTKKTDLPNQRLRENKQWYYSYWYNWY